MQLSPQHLRFLLLEQGVGAAILNVFLNGAIAWVMFHNFELVPLWGQQSIAGDTLGTCFFLPFFTALIVTPLSRRRIRSGALAVLPWKRETHPPLGWLPRGTVRRGAALGFACMAVFGPLAVLTLSGLDVNSLRLWPFISFKAAFAGALALLVTPIISVWAIAQDG